MRHVADKRCSGYLFEQLNKLWDAHLGQGGRLLQPDPLGEMLVYELEDWLELS